MMEQLKETGVIPINKDILYSLYDNLKRSDVKIHDLECKWLVIRGKRNLYVVSQKVYGKEISRKTVANHLHSLSYVSLEIAHEVDNVDIGSDRSVKLYIAGSDSTTFNHVFGYLYDISEELSSKIKLRYLLYRKEIKNLRKSIKSASSAC